MISKSTLDSLPMINPISIEEYIKINKYKHLRLGLIVANYLVSVIGPIKRLKFSQEAIGNCITFMVFEDLNCLP